MKHFKGILKDLKDTKDATTKKIKEILTKITQIDPDIKNRVLTLFFNRVNLFNSVRFIQGELVINKSGITEARVSLKN